jgi:hypothetical protein
LIPPVDDLAFPELPLHGFHTPLLNKEHTSAAKFRYYCREKSGHYAADYFEQQAFSLAPRG